MLNLSGQIWKILNLYLYAVFGLINFVSSKAASFWYVEHAVRPDSCSTRFKERLPELQITMRTVSRVRAYTTESGSLKTKHSVPIDKTQIINLDVFWVGTEFFLFNEPDSEFPFASLSSKKGRALNRSYSAHGCHKSQPNLKLMVSSLACAPTEQSWNVKARSRGWISNGARGRMNPRCYAFLPNCTVKYSSTIVWTMYAIYSNNLFWITRARSYRGKWFQTCWMFVKKEPD